MQADGAAHIDTTAYTLDEVIGQVVALVEAVEEPGVTASRHHELPRSDGARHPLPACCCTRCGRRRARWSAGASASGCTAPSTSRPAGPVIVAANHIGVADGPLLAIFAPRPVHALTKHEMFSGRPRPLPARLRPDPAGPLPPRPAAVRSSLRVLRDGGVVGVFPEGRRGAGDLARFHRGAAYLALVTGAPVVPVALLGTREPGRPHDSLPRARGGRATSSSGRRSTSAQLPWPRTKEQVGHASALLREHMLVHLDLARASTGRELPGPLPADEVEPDPATGVTEQGAS